MWSDQDIGKLLPRQNSLRFPDRGRRQIDMLFSVCHNHAEIRKSFAVKKSILAAEKIGSGDKILNSCNKRLTGFGRDQVILNAHKINSLCSRLFSLWNMQVHFISIKIRVVRIADTLIQTKCPPGSYFCL